ncbi:MAG: rubrerythrin family protein [Puniceicoccales bacterium]|jgi:rubrerythrin|nr:rubrerythrin family protein [Puniceicoccales bacterium]
MANRADVFSFPLGTVNEKSRADGQANWLRFKRKGEKMASIRGSKTEKNLLTAFAGESQARNRYTFFASQAKKEGLVQIARLFEETANQEKEHAERLFRFLEGGPVAIAATFPAGRVGSTEENLSAAASGEREEYEHMYPDFTKVANDEGFGTISAALAAIAIAERHHEERFLALLKELRDGSLFQKKEEILWECLNCGYLHRGSAAPDLCPACAHQMSYFVEKRNY